MESKLDNKNFLRNDDDNNLHIQCITRYVENYSCDIIDNSQIIILNEDDFLFESITSKK